MEDKRIQRIRKMRSYCFLTLAALFTACCFFFSDFEPILVIALMALFMAAQGVNNMAVFYDKALTDEIGPITGYDCSECDLEPPSGIHFGDTSSRFMATLEEGEICVLKNRISTEAVSVEVYCRGVHVGNVHRHYRFKFAAEISTHNYLHCTLHRATDQHYLLKFYYKNSAGRAKLSEVSALDKWTPIDSTKYNGVIDDNFLVVTYTLQLIDRHLELYRVASLKGIPDDKLNLIYEDDDYLTKFVEEHYSGYLLTLSDAQKFMRETASERTFGDNRILNQRIRLYLKAIDSDIVL